MDDKKYISYVACGFVFGLALYGMVDTWVSINYRGSNDALELSNKIRLGMGITGLTVLVATIATN